MYESFYGLKERPFLTAPNPRYLYWSEAHSLAFSIFRYGLMTKAPITVVTGEIGAGKTMLIRQFISETPDEVEVGLISNMQAGRGELLQWALQSLGEEVSEGASYVRMFDQLQKRLLSSYAQGKRVVVIVDEAQNLDVETLEELRMLSNINSDGDEILQLVLVGQPELRELLERPDLVQFVQRITADFHLNALSENDVTTYIQHRLMLAGAKWRIFTPEACAAIYRATGGIPRKVNVLCDICLVSGYSEDAKTINEELVLEFLKSAREHGIYRQFLQPGEDVRALRA